MLSVNRYAQAYVDECRARAVSQLESYPALASAARDHSGAGEAAVSSAIESFDAAFFNNLVLVLDMHFCHRARGPEGKDGNPLNEVRVLCAP